MRVLCLQHGPTEEPAAIGRWLELNGHTLVVAKLYESPLLPKEWDALVIMGGHMGVYDEADYPWLKEEKIFLNRAVASGKKLLGICLGAQLLAEALGARVYKGPFFELGWWEVEWTKTAEKDPHVGDLPPRFRAFQWHGDTFDLPQGATLLATSIAYPNQAFRLGENILAFQFHPEVDDDVLLNWVQNALDEVPKDKFVQRADEILNQTDRMDRQQAILHRILSRFFV